jgi:hypothetical protein
MCTLTFIPKPGGYLLGMNRDESLRREHALLPTAVSRDGIEAAYPREVATGGTWIAVNSAGIALALLNQNRGPDAGPKLRSRGLVIPPLIHSANMRQSIEQLKQFDFSGMMPFLLSIFFPAERVIAEWKWNGSHLHSRPWTWRQRHWFSSGISDSMATQVRGAFCQDAWHRRDAGSADWLRKVHASHAPVRGSFSVCVHRPEVASVSYTEIVFDGQQVGLHYHAGQPCQALGRFDTKVVLNNPQYFPVAS